jgi:hypothetical protein
MRSSYVGVGIAGVVSSVVFALFPLDGCPMSSGGLVETLLLLGTTFGAVLFVGFVSRPSRPKNVSPGDGHRAPTPGSEWCRRCPRCRRVVSRRRSFCPECGSNMNNATALPRG